MNSITDRDSIANKQLPIFIHSDGPQYHKTQLTHQPHNQKVENGNTDF